jgi:hypothetical protein
MTSEWMPSDERDRTIHQLLIDQLTTATTTYMANQQGRQIIPEIADALRLIIGVQYYILDGIDRFDEAEGARNPE